MAAKSVIFPANVRAMTSSLTNTLKKIFSCTVMMTLVPILILNNSLERLESIKVTSDISIARAAPAPIATPTSATARAGASSS